MPLQVGLGSNTYASGMICVVLTSDSPPPSPTVVPLPASPKPPSTGSRLSWSKKQSMAQPLQWTGPSLSGRACAAFGRLGTVQTALVHGSVGVVAVVPSNAAVTPGIVIAVGAVTAALGPVGVESSLR